MKRKPFRLDIENKILIPFVCISLATVMCFCAILYFTEYRMKLSAQRSEAETLAGVYPGRPGAGGLPPGPHQTAGEIPGPL